MVAKKFDMGRRRFLGMGAGLMVATLVPTAAVAQRAGGGNGGGGGNGRLIPAGKVGTILYTQRDAISRRGIYDNPAPTMGYLGGPNYPTDPNDLGPLVPLPGGFLETFELLAAAGYKQIEFAGYGQNAANRGGTTPNLGSGASPNYANFPAYLDYARTLRGFLDATGLEAIGNHGFIPNTWPGPGSAGGAMLQGEYDRFQLELEFASILGMEFMGTGNDPTSANNRNLEPWNLASEKWLALNQLAAPWGISVYPHNHSPAYNFLQDGPMVTVTEDRVTGAPISPVQVRGESGTRLMEHYLRTTDQTCPIELDIFWAHVAQHQHRWYYDHAGKRQELVFDPLAFAAANTNRIPLYHAKDGDRTTQPPGVGQGYDIVPFGNPGADIDFRTFFKEQGAKGFHNPNYEQDNAPGGGSDPGRSLRLSKFSANNMTNLRG